MNDSNVLDKQNNNCVYGYVFLTIVLNRGNLNLYLRLEYIKFKSIYMSTEIVTWQLH